MRAFFSLVAVGAAAVVSLGLTWLHPGQAASPAPGVVPQPGWTDMWNPGWLERDLWGDRQMGPDMEFRMERHWIFMNEGLPPAYRGARNPLPPTLETISEGRVLFEVNCAACHGKEGRGDGKAGLSLTPSPALLAYLIQRPMAVDEYLLWSVSEGGADFGTGMPAFKHILDATEIWQIISYMRTGFAQGL